MKKITRCLLAIAFVLPLLVPTLAEAQGIRSEGRDFWLGYIKGTDRLYFASQKTVGIFALVSSYTENLVTVSYFDEAGQEQQGQQFRVSKLGSVRIPLDPGRMRGALQGDVAQFTAARITSKYPVAVSYYSEGSFNGAMYQVFPTAALGKHYVVASHFDSPAANGNWSGDSASSTFLVIAPYDNTVVTITPNATTFGGHVGVNTGRNSNGIPKPFQITLRRGQTYQLLSPPVSREHDMSASVVTSTKPIAVVSGHQRAMVGDPGGAVADLDADYRDLMLEQMIPVESWESKGYVSIPFYDPAWKTNFYEEGQGDLYRFYTAEKSDQADVFVAGIVDPYTLQLGEFATPTPERDNVMEPITANSKLGKKIQVTMYDHWQGELFGSWASGYTSPNMMNVVPIDKWKKNYIWNVPNDSRYKGAQFVNVIGYADDIDRIKVIINAAPEKNLTSLPKLRGFTIPQHPELRGFQLRVGPGTYAVHSEKPFVIYQYAYEERGYKDNFGYASTVGQSFGSGEEAYAPRIEVDPHCASWDVRVFDSRANDEGLADIILLNDPDGYITRPAYTSDNVRLVPTDPQFLPYDTSVSFQVMVVNPFKDAFAAIYAVDKAGNDTVFTLTYRAPSFSVVPDSINFGAFDLGTEQCSTFKLTNTAAIGAKAVTIEEIKLRFKDQGVTIKNISASLPHDIEAGQSLEITVCFAPADVNIVHIDSLIISTDCFDAPLAIMGMGRAPEIYADDLDFGEVAVGGSEKCLPLRVRNDGTAPFTLTKDWVLHNMAEFTFSDWEKLPVVIQPRKFVELIFCYKPTEMGKDSTWQDWGHDIATLTPNSKPWSSLKGLAKAPEAVWDRVHEPMEVVCDEYDTARVFITNILNAPEVITDVSFKGLDAAEFSLIRNEHNWPLPTGGVPLDPRDSVWFDIQFKADRSKGTAVRHAMLVATTRFGPDPQIDMTGTVSWPEMNASQNSLDFGTEIKGTTVTRTVKVENTGNSVLTIGSFTIDQPFVLVSGLAVGQQIEPGMFTEVVIEATAPESGELTGFLRIIPATSCAAEGVTSLAMKGFNLAASGTGFNAPLTFVCRDRSDKVTFTNGSSDPLTLDFIDIVDLPGSQGSDQFRFANGTRRLNVNQVVGAKETREFDVTYVPTGVSTASAQINYYWSHAEGHTGTEEEVLNGSSTVIENVISVAKDDNTAYTAEVNERFPVEIKLTDDIMDMSTINRVRFGLAFRQDLFRFYTMDPGAGLTLVNPVAEPSSENNLLDTVWFEATGELKASGVLATAQFGLRLARDTFSMFEIIDPVMYDERGEACYMTIAKTPAPFTPIEFCGEETIRQYLHNRLPQSIVQITPNPANEKISIVYDVNVPNSTVTVELFDVLGQKVQTLVERSHEVGRHTETVNALGIPSGTYTLRISGNGRVESRSVMLKH